MGLETICMEKLNIDINSEDNVNSNNSSIESLFIEERISLQDLVVYESDKEQNYCLGVINIFGNKVGFIVNTYFNKKYVQNKEISRSDTVIFDSSKVKFSEEDLKLQTVKNVYLVKFVLGEFVINEKTGREQRTINYNYPIKVLKTFSKKSTAYIHVENDGVICRYKNEESKDRIDLDEETKISVQLELIKRMGDSNMFFASSFPQVLKKAGIDNYKVYADSIEEFVEVYLTPQFCFCKNFEMNGKVHPGVIVYLNGQNKDEVLANIVSNENKSSKKSISSPLLSGKFKDIDREEELLLYDDPIFDGFRNCDGIHFGIINICTSKNGFINQEYVDKRVFPNYLLDGRQSTIFETSSVNFEPNSLRLRTGKYIYLVAYFVKGTAINTKTGEEQPALDYSQPISIIKSFSRKEYIHIKIEKTGILTERFQGQDTKNREEEVQIKDNQQNYDVLRELYQNGEYYAFLTSDFFKGLMFCKMPQDIQIAALNCAAKIISSNTDIEISLNRFQNELICNATSLDFIKKWKSETGFNQDIIMECADSSVFSYELSKQTRRIYNWLNSIGYSNTRNDNYSGLTKRFGLCYNEILPYLFFIRCVAQSSRPAIERCIREFIQIVKSVQQSDIYYFAKDKDQLYSIKDFFMAIDKYVFSLNELPRLLKTSIASVFVDIGQMKQYNEMINFIEPKSMSVDRKLVNLYFDFENCTEQNIKDLLDDNVSLQLLQKVISLIWEHYCDVEILPEKLICVLAWICEHDASTSVDEIIRYHLVNKKFEKLQKTVQLMNSFEKICSMAEANGSIYVMASYIRYVICEDIYADKFPERTSYIKAQWRIFSLRFYDAVITDTGEINCDNEKDYFKLFRIFRLDMPNQTKLQYTYSRWYLNNFIDKNVGIEEYENNLEWLFVNRAYKAYCDLTLEYWRNNGQSSEIYIRRYVNSLVELKQYADAIDYLQQHANIEKSVRNELIIHVLAENFRNYGLSPVAFSAFSSDFLIDDVIELLLKEFKPNQYHLITCLIALYCGKKNYLRAAYLYVIFHSKTENGYTRLYAQIRRKTSSFLGKLKNHYDVVEFAFFTLLPSEIIEFLKWTQMISIPTLKGYNATHPFAFFYKRIMDSPTDEKSWLDFYSHIIKRMDMNAWIIVVCESILNQVFNYKGGVNSVSAIRNVLNTARPEELPLNILPYIFKYIMCNNDLVLCEDLTRLLSNSEVYQRLIENSLWADNYKEERELFKVFCLQQFSESGNESYYKLMPLLGVTYDISELAVLTQTAGDKSFLYREICNEYINSTNTAKIIDLLNNTEWNNMTSIDLAMLDLLRLLYRDEEVFLEDRLFANETDVYRFKTDCAKILSSFPDKETLFEFDKNCVNDQHKLLVYSYVFCVMYDEDIYHKYEYSYENLSADTKLYYTYMRFAKTVFKSQLEWNREYWFFYKKWRYLKLYLASVLYADSIVDDYKILEEMEKNGHYESVYAEGYRPFVENVNKFWLSEEITGVDKQCILYSLMMGRMGDFLQMRGETIRFYSKVDKLLLKEMISQLDYREVNLSFYRIYWPRIKNSDFSEAEDIASALSNYTSDVLSAMHKRIHDPELNELFESLALQEKPTHVTRGVFQLEEAMFLKYKDVLLPLLCSRQFLFLIYGSTRSLVVQRKAEPGMLKFTALTDYISKYNPNEAKSVQGYLMALNACLHKNRADVLAILRDIDIETDIPAQWKQEANNIKCYAEGKNNTFKPDSTIVDSSLKNKHVDVKFWFLEKLQKALNVGRRRLDPETSASLYEKFLDQNAEFHDRVKACLDLILNYPKLGKEQKKALQIPTKNSLILSLGLEVIEESNFFNTTDRLSVLFNLYSGRKMFRDNREGAKRLNEILGQSLKTNVSLELWVKFYPVIKEFLDDNHMLTDEFMILQERILKKCAVLLQDNISQEKRYIGLKQLLTMSEGLKSLYSRNVFDAIRRVRDRIKNNSRLEITIVNEKCQMTDGFVYFMIRNIGKCTVTLSDEYMIVFKQEGHLDTKIEIDNIKELQSGFITGGRAKPILHGAEDAISVNLAIYKKSYSDKRELLCDTSETLNICDIVDHLQITRRNRYKVGQESAVTDDDMLFGRDNIKNILKYMIPEGVTVMYGPSRIGKTSIMNWIRNTLAVNQGNVISIIFGGEGGMGKDSDYQENFVNSNEHHPVPYRDDNQMSEYLMVSTIVQSMTTDEMKPRLKLPSKKKVSNNVFEKIVAFLQDRGMSIAIRYYHVNKLLREEELELWLLLDEFQQVVERWEPKASCEFVRVCKMLLYDGENSNIKLILCGSDDLLKHMVLKDESVWRGTFPEYARVSVEALNKDSFCDMIKKDKKIFGTNVSYSDSALDTLFLYTGGVALYGKEIGNFLLDEMEREPLNYRGRNIVYPSDIAKATQQLLKRQASELSTEAKEGIREVYDAVTKNLKPDTDMQYLWYIAKWLKENPDCDSFAETTFAKNGKLRNVKELHDSLEIAVARGILDCKESSIDGVNNYVFRTIFYYYAFLGSAKLDKSKIFNQEESEEDEKIIEENALTMIQKFGELSESDQMTVLSSVYHQKINPKAQERFRKGIGDQYGDVVRGSKINIQVNIQNMTNALTNIISGQNVLESYKKLPTLGTYIASTLTEQQQLTLKNKYEELLASDLSDEQRVIVQEEIYELSSPAVDAIANDYVAAEMNAIMDGTYSLDDESATEDEFYDFVGVSKDEIDELKQMLPGGIQIQFDFAVMLHKIFYQLRKEQNIDYCPVVILYCKMIEGLLKEKHLEIYIRKLSRGCFPKVRLGKRDFEWNYFMDGNGNIDRKKIRQNRKKLTLGSFSFPLGKISNINNFGSNIIINEDVIEALATPIGADYPNLKDLQLWNKHAQLLPWIREYRNRSAHELTPISSTDMDNICKIIFGKRELDIIVKLIQRQ